MYYERLISEKIKSAAATFPCLVLTGARQVGKTTLLKRCFPEHHFVSLDLPSVAEMAETDPETFLRKYPAPLLVDEVQYAPKLFRHLKVVIDQDRHNPGQFVLTGSQKFTLMKEVSDSLAGRAAIFSLEALSSAELGIRADVDIARVLARGFYPELWRQPELDQHQYYSSYLATYLERDVRQILNVTSLRDFERFLRACAARSGQLLNLTELGRDVGIKSQTSREWLNVLEASNQVCLLEPYFENVGKRLVKSPKLYMSDPGLLCFLLGVDAKTMVDSPMLGAIWETFVFSEFRKQQSVHGGSASVWYYRDDQGREADFVLMHEGRLDIFDAKWSESPDKRWFQRLDEVAHILSRSKSQKLGQQYILCRASDEFWRQKVQCIHPCQYFL